MQSSISTQKCKQQATESSNIIVKYGICSQDEATESYYVFSKEEAMQKLAVTDKDFAGQNLHDASLASYLLQADEHVMASAME